MLALVSFFNCFIRSSDFGILCHESLVNRYFAELFLHTDLKSSILIILDFKLKQMTFS